MSWLGDSAAVAVLSFDVDAESPILAQGRRYADHAMVMTHQAYGPLVGVPRLLELLDDFGIEATFFVPGLTADRYPQTVERIVAAGHEVGHHSYSHRSPVDLGEAGEREDFERALEALNRVGVKPKGHRSALWEASWGTPALVAEYGLEYDSTLMDDDRPYLLETGQLETIIVIALGNLVGCAIFGLFCIMGHRTGVNQIVLSRSAFGRRGAFVPGVAQLLLTMGWVGVNTWVVLDLTLGVLTELGIEGGTGLKYVIGFALMAV
jgi:Polysaccharide deacetylase/Permease for cytosine/purines, uracil, thiamine, allantoin